MNMGKGLMAGLAMSALMGGMIGLTPTEEAMRTWRQRVDRLRIASSKRTPKPEEMFAPMLDDGSAVLIRRRGKPPLLKPTTPRRHYYNRKV